MSIKELVQSAKYFVDSTGEKSHIDLAENCATRDLKELEVNPSIVCASKHTAFFMTLMTWQRL